MNLIKTYEILRREKLGISHLVMLEVLNKVKFSESMYLKDVALEMKVCKSAISHIKKKLVENGFINGDEYGKCFITEKGQNFLMSTK
jgi:Mn-dependent DtxR family transcriptional regulator